MYVVTCASVLSVHYILNHVKHYMQKYNHIFF